jgi:2-oxo-4-hydroxy-4-carboxy--5-ureidoimidazoline (OHCU) decarboxylase
MTPTETTLSYMRVLHDHIVAHGVPVALYSDKHSIFRINAKEADPAAETQFSRAARELNIECIHAHSPQAKGRVERANQTLQDRLVKEMRLAGINDMADSANAWLPGYIECYNRRFAVNPV